MNEHLHPLFKKLLEPLMKPQEITVLHVIGPLGEPKCPLCGSLHEDEGGEVSERGSWDEGPFYWQCGKCGEQWGHA